MSQIKQNPFERLPRYFQIFAQQASINIEYVYFLILGIMLDAILLVPVSLFSWALIIALNLLVGAAAIGSVVHPIDKAFQSLSINFESGYGKPFWIVKGKYPAATDDLEIYAGGYTQEQFEKEKELIASRLGEPIRSLTKSASSKVLAVSLKRTVLPKFLSYGDLDLLKLKDGEFYVGQSEDAVEKMALKDMPHMLIAGQTGGGKTQFIKQMMATLLSKSRFVHLGLIDMKGGIDFQDFKDLPNFEMVTEYDASVAMLDQVKDLYEARKSHLLEKKKTDWSELSLKDLSQDSALKDRPIGPVVIYIDELADLTPKASKSAANSPLQEQLASLARLIRCTGIHLVLCSQRPDKKVLNTQVTGNTPVKLCFSVPNVATSTLVIGDMLASTLGNHKGRAVLRSSDSKIVQAPLLERDGLSEILETVNAKLKDQGYQRTLARVKQSESAEKTKGRKTGG